MRRQPNPLRLLRPITFLLLFLPVTARTVPAEQRPCADPADLWKRSSLLGDMGGLRTLPAKYGISIGLTENSEQHLSRPDDAPVGTLLSASVFERQIRHESREFLISHCAALYINSAMG